MCSYAPFSREAVTSVPLYDVSHGNTPIKYVAMDVDINSKKMRFMVDTGATINLIKKSALNTLGETNCVELDTSCKLII